MRLARRSLRGRAAAFTLAEVAVTIVIVGIGLVLVLEALNTCKLAAAHTGNLKLARELGLYTLGQVESGLFRDEDVSSNVLGNYAEQGYSEFYFEIFAGDNVPPSRAAEEGRHDSWAPTPTEVEEQELDEEENPEDHEPFEHVIVRVTFPKFLEYTNELTLERWIPWEQVYGPDEEETDAAATSDPSAAGSSGGAGAGEDGDAGSAGTGGKGR